MVQLQKIGLFLPAYGVDFPDPVGEGVDKKRFAALQKIGVALKHPLGGPTPSPPPWKVGIVQGATVVSVTTDEQATQNVGVNQLAVTTTPAA